MLTWPWTCSRISFWEASKVNSPELTITCCLPIFMAWIFMMLIITSVQFIFGLIWNEKRGWTKLPLASLVGSMKRGNILNNTVRNIICLELLFLLRTVVFRTRIMQWPGFWILSRRGDSLGRLLCIYISRSTQKMTVTTHFIALRCCTGIKLS